MQIRVMVLVAALFGGCSRNGDALPERGYPLLLTVEGECACSYSIYRGTVFVLAGDYDCAFSKVVQERLHPGIYRLEADDGFGRKKELVFEKTVGIQELAIDF